MSKRSANKRPRKGSSNRRAALTPSSRPPNPSAWSLPTDPPSNRPSAEDSPGEPEEHHDFFLTGDAGSYPEGPANATSKSSAWPEAEPPKVVRTPAMDARRARNKKIVSRLVAGLVALNAVALLVGFVRRAANTSGPVSREVHMNIPNETSQVGRLKASPAGERPLPAPAAHELTPAPIAATSPDTAATPPDTAPKEGSPPTHLQPNARSAALPAARATPSPTASSGKPVTVTTKATGRHQGTAAVSAPRRTAAPVPASTPRPTAPVPNASRPTQPSGTRPTAAFPIL